MAWSTTFKDLLKQPSVPLGVLFEVVKPVSGGVGQSWFAATDPGLSPDAPIAIDNQGRLQVSLSPVGVQLQSWTYQAGAFSVVVVLEDGLVLDKLNGPSSAAQQAAQALRRGALCRLLLGQAGAARSAYEPLRIGRIQQVTNLGWYALKIEAWDITSVLRSRLSTAPGSLAEDSARLFYNSAGNEDNLTADYTAGTSTTLSLAGVVTNRFLKETGGTGAVKVRAQLEGGGGSQNWFYRTFTGYSGTQILTGVPTTASILGTTHENADGQNLGVGFTGASIEAVVYLSGHPGDITWKILTSTGNGTNGSKDTYPEQWGFGIPSDYIDEQGFLRLSQELSVSGTYSWNWLVEDASVEDGTTWLLDQLSDAGVWLCVRQGQISIRAAVDPSSSLFIDAEITDADLALDGNGNVISPEVDWYDGESPAVYSLVRVETTSGSYRPSSSSSANTLPRRARYDYSLSSVLRAVSNANDIADEVIARVKLYLHHPGEIIKLRLQGLHWGLCPGDVVSFTSSLCRGRLTSTVGGYFQRNALVTEVHEDILSNSVGLRLAVAAADSKEDHG